VEIDMAEGAGDGSEAGRNPPDVPSRPSKPVVDDISGSDFLSFLFFFFLFFLTADFSIGPTHDEKEKLAEKKEIQNVTENGPYV
jgi:hypothetical protein